MTLRGSLMVCGTASDVGKSRIVAGLCRVLARQHVSVAPFKAQNMSLNSFVTSGGHEIARSIANQAFAAGVDPDVAMNPILLKPSGPRTSQLIVMGHAIGEFGQREYPERKPELVAVVGAALDDVRRRFDVVILEGAGGAAEINLLEGDLVNLPLARRAAVPALLVGDIERGGVFASIYGTVALLPPELREPLAGFVINKLRGDATLLRSGIDELEQRCQLPCVGVLPHLGELSVDAEDSMNLASSPTTQTLAEGDVLDVAVIRLPHLSNFTDFDPLLFESGVLLRYVSDPGSLGTPDLIILPGSKATVNDLEWLRARHLDQAIALARTRGSGLLGICAGLQMMGTTIVDGVESATPTTNGLGVVAATTRFAEQKVTRQRRGVDATGLEVVGYQIHHGHTRVTGSHRHWFTLEDADDTEGVCEPAQGLWATSLHGLFDADQLRTSFLSDVARRRDKRFVPTSVAYAARRDAEIDRVADALERYLDLDLVFQMITSGELQ